VTCCERDGRCLNRIVLARKCQGEQPGFVCAPSLQDTPTPECFDPFGFEKYIPQHRACVCKRVEEAVTTPPPTPSNTGTCPVVDEARQCCNSAGQQCRTVYARVCGQRPCGTGYECRPSAYTGPALVCYNQYGQRNDAPQASACNCVPTPARHRRAASKAVGAPAPRPQRRAVILSGLTDAAGLITLQIPAVVGVYQLQAVHPVTGAFAVFDYQVTAKMISGVGSRRRRATVVDSTIVLTVPGNFISVGEKKT
jgi:hypothetical protein